MGTECQFGRMESSGDDRELHTLHALNATELDTETVGMLNFTLRISNDNVYPKSNCVQTSCEHLFTNTPWILRATARPRGVCLQPLLCTHLP